MKFDEAREMGEVLGRTASIREKAAAPEGLIMAQVARGELKLIAGSAMGQLGSARTVIAKVGPHEGDTTVGVMHARAVLQMLKSLKGKGEVEFSLTDKGFLAKTNTGGELVIGAEYPLDLPRVLRPRPDDSEAPTVYLPENSLDRMAAITAIMTNAVEFGLMYVEFSSATEKEGKFKATDNLYAAEFGPFGALAPGHYHIDKDYISAMRGLTERGTMRFLPKPAEKIALVQTTVGRYLFVGVQAFVPKLPRFPNAQADVTIKAGKSDIISLMRTIGSGAPMVTLKATGSEAVLMNPNGSESPVKGEVDGVGVIRFSPTALTKALNVLKGDVLTVQYLSGTASPMRVVGEDKGWPILLAPAKV